MLHLIKREYGNSLTKFFLEKYFLLIFVISFFVLISAYVLEFLFNYPPCKLCVYQRIPYFFLCVLSLFSLIIKKKYLLTLTALFCVTGSFLISGFHTLVERKLVDFEIGCTSSDIDFENIEELRDFLEKAPIIKCDEIYFSVLGLSLANINLIISSFLIILSIYIIKNYEKKISR